MISVIKHICPLKRIPLLSNAEALDHSCCIENKNLQNNLLLSSTTQSRVPSRTWVPSSRIWLCLMLPYPTPPRKGSSISRNDARNLRSWPRSDSCSLPHNYISWNQIRRSLSGSTTSGCMTTMRGMWSVEVYLKKKYHTVLSFIS